MSHENKTLTERWVKAENWLSLNTEPIHSSLNPPVTSYVLRQTAQYYKSRLPEDFVEPYTSRDGQNMSSSANLMFQ